MSSNASKQAATARRQQAQEKGYQAKLNEIGDRLRRALLAKDLVTVHGVAVEAASVPLPAHLTSQQPAAKQAAVEGKPRTPAKAGKEQA